MPTCRKGTSDLAEWKELPRRSGWEWNITNHPGNMYGETQCPSDIERDVAHGKYWKKTVGEQPLSGSWVLPPYAWSKSQSTSTITNHETLSCDDHRNIQPHPDNVPSTSHDQTLRQPHGDTQQDSPCIHIPQSNSDSIPEPSMSRPTDEGLEQFMRQNQDETKIARLVKEGGMNLMSLFLNQAMEPLSSEFKITRTLCNFQHNYRRHEMTPATKNEKHFTRGKSMTLWISYPIAKQLEKDGFLQSVKTC